MSADGQRHEVRLRAAPGLTTDALQGGPGTYVVHRHLDPELTGGLRKEREEWEKKDGEEGGKWDEW